MRPLTVMSIGFQSLALWDYVASVKGYLASFKKFFIWMGETGLISPQIVADVLDTMKSTGMNTSERLLSNYVANTMKVVGGEFIPFSIFRK
jgi:hypothetical protein